MSCLVICGVAVDIGNPVLTLEQAFALNDATTRMKRFNGNPDALSVNQHHNLCGLIAHAMGKPQSVLDWADCHDLHEGALGDIISPVKEYIDSDKLRHLEKVWDIAIAKATGYPPPTDETYEAVREIDLISRRIEMEELGMEPDEDLPQVPKCVDVWGFLNLVKPEGRP